MNNEYENGRYGTHLKYFQDVQGYNAYLDSSTTVKALPNVSYCAQEQNVKYNWNFNTDFVLTERSNKALWDILTLSGINPTLPGGFTADDLAAITLNDIYDSRGTSNEIDWTPGWKGKKENNLPHGYSIFFGFDLYDSVYTQTGWTFDEFQYFTSITVIPDDMFRCCVTLRSITIPSTVNTIDTNAFHDCHQLTNVVIKNSPNSIDIYDEPYSEWVNGQSNSAFGYAGYTGHLHGDQFEDDFYSSSYSSPLNRMIGEHQLTFYPES